MKHFEKSCMICHQFPSSAWIAVLLDGAHLLSLCGISLWRRRSSCDTGMLVERVYHDNFLFLTFHMDIQHVGHF